MGRGGVGEQATGVGSSFQASSLGDARFLAESGVGPLPGMVASHIGHLVPQLCIFCLSFLLLFILLL